VRPYEAMVVLEPGLADDAMEAVLNRITGAITSQGGEVTHLDRWGKRRLAYEIGGHTEGYYVLIKFQGNRRRPSNWTASCASPIRSCVT